MENKKGIIVSVIILLLIIIGLVAWSSHDEKKLDDKEVIEKDEDKTKEEETEEDSTYIEEIESVSTPTAVAAVSEEPVAEVTQVSLKAPVFDLSDIEVETIEFGSSYTLPTKTIQDENGEILTAVVTYEYRANIQDEFVEVDEFNTSNSGEYRITYTITNEAGLSTSHSFITKVQDTTNPVVNGVEPDATVNQEVVLTIDESNEYIALLSKDNGAANEYISGTPIVEAGKYHLEVTDVAGNYTEVDFEIVLGLPTITLNYAVSDTHDSVVVTLETDEAIQELVGWTKISDTKYQKAYTENTTEEVTVTDLDGNSATETVVVNIPATLNFLADTFSVDESIEFSASTIAGDLQGTNVIGKITFSDDSVITNLESSDDESTWTVSTGEFGDSSGFEFDDITKYYRVEFDTPGTYTVNFEIVNALDSTVIYQTTAEIVVE